MVKLSHYFIKEFLSKKSGRFIIVGLVSTFLNYIVNLASYKITGLTILSAQIGYLFGIFIGFHLINIGLLLPIKRALRRS